MSSSLKISFGCVVALCCVGILLFWHAANAQEPAKIYVGTSASHSPTLFPLYVARQKGMFKEQGLEVTPIYMVPRVQVAALLAKEIPYVTGMGSVLTGAARGLPIKLVWVFMAHSPQVLVSRKDFTSVGDLRGKSIAVTQSGATEHRFLLLILKKFGVDAQSVKVVSLRETPNRILALKEGVVQAAILDVFSALRLEREGFKQLAFVKDAAELPATGLATTDDRIRDRRSEVKRMLTALLGANSYIKSAAPDLPAMMKEFIKAPDTDTSRIALDAYKPLWSMSGLTSDDGLRNVASLGDIPFNVPVAKLADWSILKEIGNSSSPSSH